MNKHLGPVCPEDGHPLRAMPSGWWCAAVEHDKVALDAVEPTEWNGTLVKSVKTMRAEGPGRNLWRTYELEAS